MPSFCYALRSTSAVVLVCCTSYTTHSPKLEIKLQIPKYLHHILTPFLCNQYRLFFIKIFVPVQKSLIALQCSFICKFGVLPKCSFHKRLSLEVLVLTCHVALPALKFFNSNFLEITHGNLLLSFITLNPFRISSFWNCSRPFRFT